MEYIFKPALIFTLILACMNARASYYGEFEIVAEVVSKDGSLYELAPIAERATGGHETESIEYSFYLFPKTLKKQIALPSKVRVGDLVKLKKKIASNPSTDPTFRYHNEKYSFIAITKQDFQEQRSNIIGNWPDGSNKEFYFKATKPFSKEAVSGPLISSDRISGADGVLQFFIRFSEKFTGDFNEDAIKNYLSDFHYNLILTKAPIEIIKFFKSGGFNSGKTDTNRPVIEIEKIESNIIHGYITGKIDGSSFINGAPSDYKGISYTIRFEVPINSGCNINDTLTNN
jgi:hypothetical protein